MFSSSPQKRFLGRPGVSRRSVSSSSSNPSKSSISQSLQPDVDPPPKPWPILQFLAFAAILLFGSLQFFPPTHFRDPFDSSRTWIPFSSNISSGNAKASGEYKSSLTSMHNGEPELMHIFSWMDCLDLRMLAVLVNSTLTYTRYPDKIHFHFFTPKGDEDKVSYYKLKVLFPHSNLEVIGQKEFEEKLKTLTSKGEYLWPSLHDVAPFIVPSIDPSIGRALYVSPNLIIKGRVEELFKLNMSNNAIAAVEDCTRSLGRFVNFDVLDAIQRSTAKPWVSTQPYEKDACIPNLDMLIVEMDKLDKDLTETILWWSKILNPGKERTAEINPAVVLALYGKYQRLSTVWEIRDFEEFKSSNETNILRFGGQKNVCSGEEHQINAGSEIWKKYLPPMASHFLDH